MESGGIKSIEVGMKLMRALLYAGKAISLSELAKAAHFATPKAHRYLASLERSGLVERNVSTGRYGLGPLAVELGIAGLAQIDGDGLGRAAIVELSAETGVTSCLTVWTGEAVIVTVVELGQQTIYTGTRMGSRLSLLGSASGRLYLAHLPEEETHRVLTEELRHAPMDRSNLHKQLGQIRHDGVSVVHDMVMNGMSGLAVPVFDHSNHIVYTITLLGPSTVFDNRIGGPLVQQARLAAQLLSKRLGYTGRDHAHQPGRVGEHAEAM